MSEDVGSLKKVLHRYMAKVPEIRKYCNDCLNVRRYGGNVVLMVVDASFVSLGVNYFKVVLPKVLEFKRSFADSKKIKSLEDLSKFGIDELAVVWKNKRSWNVAKQISSYLINLDEDDREALIKWAKNSKLEDWKEDPIGRIVGVGINTYQYLRMMGGIDTVMPDKIVRRVFKRIFDECKVQDLEGLKLEIPRDDIKFIKLIEKIAQLTNYKPIELCWMTWFVYNIGDIKNYELINKV